MFGCSKLMTSLVAIVATLAIAGRTVSGHTYHTGNCPSVEPMAGFDMRQVRGVGRIRERERLNEKGFC